MKQNRLTRIVTDALSVKAACKSDERRICIPRMGSITRLARVLRDAVSMDTNTDDVLIVVFCAMFRWMFNAALMQAKVSATSPATVWAYSARGMAFAEKRCRVLLPLVSDRRHCDPSEWLPRRSRCHRLRRTHENWSTPTPDRCHSRLERCSPRCDLNQGYCLAFARAH